MQKKWYVWPQYNKYVGSYIFFIGDWIDITLIIFIDNNDYCFGRDQYNIIIADVKCVLCGVRFAPSAVRVLNFVVECVYSIVSSYGRVCANRSALDVTHYKSINGNMVQCFNGFDIVFDCAGRDTYIGTSY